VEQGAARERATERPSPPFGDAARAESVRPGPPFPEPYKPYAGGAGFRELDGTEGPDGAPRTTRDRATCCFFYTLRPEDTCLTCPRTCDAERVRRLTAAA